MDSVGGVVYEPSCVRWHSDIVYFILCLCFCVCQLRHLAEVSFELRSTGVWINGGVNQVIQRLVYCYYLCLMYRYAWLV